MSKRMTCERCGGEMNHQAEKLVEPASREEAVAVSSLLQGVVVEVYACPSCGWIGSRRRVADDGS